MPGWTTREILYSAYQVAFRHSGPTGAEKTVFSTCFYVGDGKETYLITNKHNFSLPFADSKYVGYEPIGMTVRGYFGVDQYAECDFADATMAVGAPANEAKDVIAMRMTGVRFRFKRLRKPGEPTDHKTTELKPLKLGFDFFLKPDEWQKVNPGDEVAFPGYPEHFDRNGARPILRTGSIASDPSNDYWDEKLMPGRRIAFEGHSTQGSSGSPVFAVVETGLGTRERVFIGVNAGHLVGSEPRLGTIHANLSYCFKADCVTEAIGAIPTSSA